MPISLLPEQNHGRLSGSLHGKKGSEVCVGRNHNSIFIESTTKNYFVGSLLQPDVSNVESVVPRIFQQSRNGRRQGVVD
jgi:hypothetical protein